MGGLQLLTRGFPVLGRIGYVPRGPILASREPALVDAMLAALQDHARRHRIAVLRSSRRSIGQTFPRCWSPGGCSQAGCIQRLRRASWSMWGQIGTRTRSSGRCANDPSPCPAGAQAGLAVRTGRADDLPVLQAVIEATAQRQGFDPYPADYYRRLWAVFGASGQARLLIAEHKGVPLSAMLLIAFGSTVIYKIGGWADVEGSPPGANELMHWTGIAWEHDAGYRHYDFEGIPVGVAQEVATGTLPTLGVWRSSSSGSEATPWFIRAPTTSSRGRSPVPCFATSCRGPNGGKVSPTAYPDALLIGRVEQRQDLADVVHLELREKPVRRPRVDLGRRSRRCAAAGRGRWATMHAVRQPRDRASESCECPQPSADDRARRAKRPGRGGVGAVDPPVPNTCRSPVDSHADSAVHAAQGARATGTTLPLEGPNVQRARQLPRPVIVHAAPAASRAAQCGDP